MSILILLLAITSAVFSYFLFAKRGQMVDGWSKMATAINQTATELDRNSGTKLAAELTPAALGHDQYDALDGKLAKLTAQTKQLVIERDALADALRRIGSTVEMKNLGSEAAFRSLDTYSTNKDDVINGVRDAINRRNSSLRNLVELARQNLKVSLDEKALQSGDRAAMEKLSGALQAIAKRRDNYESGLRNIAGQTGTTGLDFAEDKYSASTGKAVSSVKALKDRYNDTNSKLTKAQNDIKNLESTIANRNNEISNLKKTVAGRDNQLNELKRALNIDTTQNLPTPWKPGSEEARRALLGKVLEVNTHYGYICIDLGKDTMVYQQIGNKTEKVDPKVAPGLELVVARGNLDGEQSDFVARVKLEKVDNSSSIANIPPESLPIQVGDIVYYEAAK